MIEISIKEGGNILRKIPQLKSLLQKELISSRTNISTEFTQRAADYPPESEANAPPPPYWQRGVGKIGNQGVVTPSQKLGQSWSVTHSSNETTIVNPTTYAAYVHSPIKQAWFHKLRGWKTTIQIFKEIGISVDSGHNAQITEADAIGKRIVTRVTTFAKSLF